MPKGSFLSNTQRVNKTYILNWTKQMIVSFLGGIMSKTDLKKKKKMPIKHIMANLQYFVVCCYHSLLSFTFLGGGGLTHIMGLCCMCAGKA